jgi:hypothetical protein
LTLSWLTLPTWGGLHSGELCEHPTPEPATNGPAYSSLPTPTADNSRGLPSSSTDYQSLANVATMLLQTPRARLAGNTAMRDRGHGFLEEQIANLLPTPAVNDMGRGKTVEWWDEWAPRQQASDGRLAPHGKSLEIEALRIGDHTVPPSPGGNTSPDGPHLNQHNQDVTGNRDSQPGLWNG